MSLRVLLACAALMAAPQLSAQTVFCVDTVSELDSALVQLTEEDVEVRLVRGTYDVSGIGIGQGGTVFPNVNGYRYDLILRGGYAPGCGSRTRSALDTVITRPNGPVLIVLSTSTSGGFGSAGGNLTLESLTFRNIPRGIFLRTETGLSPEYSLRVTRVWFDRVGTVNVDDTTDTFFNQVLLTNSTARDRDNVLGCAVGIETTGVLSGPSNDFTERVNFSHVTIARSQGAGLCIGNDEASDYRIALANNIFWDNASDDIRLRHDTGTPIDASLVANTYQTFSSLPATAVAPSGTLSSNPNFVNPNAEDWELGSGSASINSATVLPLAGSDFDLKGDPRVFSTAADRGALESPIGSNATTLVVTTTADPAQPTPGTLRQAILDANANPGFNRIVFDIGTTCGPRLINLFSPLPPITGSLKIDGYSQPGATRNTQSVGNDGDICVILAGTASAISGLTVPSSVSDNTALEIDGLGFSNFPLLAIQLSGGNGHSVRGSQFGGNIGPYDLLPSGYGVQVTVDARDVTIGGPDPADRNTFGEATIAAISLSGIGSSFTRDARIENNYIGLTPSGFTALPNATGISVRGSFNTIVGNVISSNDGSGIDVRDPTADSNVIERNRIGLTAGLCVVGNCDRGNGFHGVLIRDGATNTRVRNNLIYNNDGDGVAVVGSSSNSISSNEFRDNLGEGIDLGNDGPTANNNDYLAPPLGAGNGNLNHPFLTEAVGGASGGVVRGTLATRNGQYLIQLYATNESCSPLVRGQGRWLVGQTYVTVSGGSAATGNGSASFEGVPIARADIPNFFGASPRRILATATAAVTVNGARRFVETSEFSGCIDYTFGEGIFANGFEG